VALTISLLTPYVSLAGLRIEPGEVLAAVLFLFFALLLLIEPKVDNAIFTAGVFLDCCALRGFHSRHAACTAALVFKRVQLGV